MIGRLVFLASIGAIATANLSCNVNDYCLNCATGDAGDGDGGGDDADLGDGGVDDGDTDGGCVNTGPEVCDDEDNDCDGNVDEGQLPQIGELCDNQMGECAGGVKECTNGVVTCTKPAVPEICDLKDNDCNGLTDEGDPGGGAVCGTNTGECVAGVNRCVTGMIQCTGAVGPGTETCNNRDDDCDTMFDENLVLGACVPGVDGPVQGNEGECNLGMRQCIGGVTSCVGADFPTFELCDAAGLDQDCDGLPNNGYNTATDPQNCGGCGNVCNLPNAFEGCAGGMCTVVACAPNFFNNDNNPANGCEFDCGHPFLGAEVCNGIDDDCDGLVDAADPDLTAPIGLCDSDGACATQTVLSCDGMLGWRCHYNNPNVQTSDPDRTQIIPETRCDSDIVAGSQADNDCDNRIDEAQTLGAACSNGMSGDCRNSGTTVCNTADRNGPAVCNFTTIGPGMSLETCDGRDNNCNNQVDEGAATGNLAGQNWVTVPGTSVQMMKYEASRPGATMADAGTLQTHVCSQPSVLPWTNITYPQAVAACASVSARLCTEAEWQDMCMPSTTYPVAGPGTGLTDFSFIEAEAVTNANNVTIGGRTWTRQQPLALNGVTAMAVPEAGFSQLVPANAAAQSARMDYPLTLATGTAYNVWMRMRMTGVGGLTNVFRTNTAPVVGASATSNAATQVNDLVIVFTYSTRNGTPTHTLQGGFTEIFTRAVDDGATDSRLSVAWRTAASAGAQSYQAYVPQTGSASMTGLLVLRAGVFNTSFIQGVTTADNNGGNFPNPPAITPAVPSLIITVAGFNITAAADMVITPPTGWTEQWEAAGTTAPELQTAATFSSRTIDPPVTAMNLATNNTTSGTIAIGVNRGASAFVGLATGAGPAGANAAYVGPSTNDTWEWVPGPTITSGGSAAHTLSVYVREDGLLIDTIAIARQGTTSPTFSDAWAYQNNPRTAQPQVCNGDELDTDGNAGNGDQDAILATASLGMCFANHPDVSVAGDTDAFDMSGNVKEWTTARVANQNPIRGGSANNDVTGLTCKLNFTLADDDFFFPNVGFRCCR
ncbi:MAG: MopE-related protein [Kofleriaceae bacterium]